MRLSVLLPLPLGPLSYLAPEGAPHPPRPGLRVAVPFRKGVRVGVVMDVEDAAEGDFALRHAIGYLDAEPFLDEAGLAFLHRAAELYFAPPGQLLADLVPFLEPPLHHEVRLVDGAARPGLPQLALWRDASELDPALLDELREGGVLEERVRARKPTRKTLVPLREPTEKLTPKQRAALETLRALGEAESQTALAAAAGVGPGVVRALVEKGYAGWREVELELTAPPPAGPPVSPLPVPEPPPRINGGRWSERLQLAAGLAREGETLVLFPERYALERAYDRWPPPALPFHGGQSPDLRRALWREAAPVVLGSYQALLMPRRWQRIVVMDEGSDSYKLASGSRAHAVRLAELRAEMLGASLHYVSLTPAVEVVEKPGLLVRPPRTRVLPVDLRRERGWPLSGRAVELLAQVPEKGRQALVLVARRGYSGRLFCKSCDWQPICPNCDLPLRFHKPGRRGRLVCHQCGHSEPAPEVCPVCGGEVFGYAGPGVQWVAEEIRRRLPELPVYQYSAERKDDLAPLQRGEPGAVVGTTALLRTPAPPELALILLPYAEGFLPASDFRAPERYHRLLWQLADLHPTRSPLIALQTFEPDHPAVEALIEGDVTSVPETELVLRRMLGYPPAVRMVVLEFSHRQEATARAAAMETAEFLKKRIGLASGATEPTGLTEPPAPLLGPAPAPVPRVRGRYVFHLILRSPNPAQLAAWLRDLPAPKGARLRLDPDPVGFV
ncbi:MAG TPA: primosomal protein N', partial [Oceanithermus profundus]|nr:primosomal protein N' [Oceanithermus profundus]